MFNRLLALFLIIAFQSMPFATLLADAGFKLNQRFISEKLCENRNKPKLNCHGKCYLNKMQKKAAEQEEAGKNLLKEFQFQQLFYNQVSATVFYSSDSNSFQVPEDHIRHLKGWPQGTDRPPGIV